MNHLDNIASRSDTKHSFKKHIRAMDTLAPFTDIESAFPDDTVALLTATRNPSLTATLSQAKGQRQTMRLIRSPPQSIPSSSPSIPLHSETRIFHSQVRRR